MALLTKLCFLIYSGYIVHNPISLALIILQLQTDSVMGVRCESEISSTLHLVKKIMFKLALSNETISVITVSNVI